MRREQDEANLATRPTLRLQVAERIEVSETLAHLLAFDKQVRVVQPISDKRLAGGGLALGDFVFVVREDKVFAAAMDVERLAKMLHAHHATLDVPARSARTP